MEIWERVRKYLLFWGVVFIALTIYTIIRYGGVIVDTFAESIMAIFIPIFPIGILLFGIWLMIRSLFR